MKRPLVGYLIAIVIVLQSPFARTSEKTSDLANTVIPEKLGRLTIPSDVDRLGVPAITIDKQAVAQSWDFLPSYLQQTLQNLRQQNARGLLYVHALEDIMGATECFEETWNAAHPQDQRFLCQEDFQQLFTAEEFVTHYVPYILAQRVLISGSVWTMHEQAIYTNTDTFSPVCLILEVPRPCVALAKRRDAQTRVEYVFGTKKLDRAYWYEFSRIAGTSLISLDALVRFPDAGTVYTEQERYFIPEMNEVAIYSCAIEGKTVYRPSVVGVLINRTKGTVKHDLRNGERNAKLAEAALAFARDNNLARVIYEPKVTTQLGEANWIALATEWFGFQASFLNYALERTWHQSAPERLTHDAYWKAYRESLPYFQKIYPRPTSINPKLVKEYEQKLESLIQNDLRQKAPTLMADWDRLVQRQQKDFTYRLNTLELAGYGLKQ